MLGRLLCWLGVHDMQITGINMDEWNQICSIWGNCTRENCHEGYQFDN